MKPLTQAIMNLRSSAGSKIVLVAAFAALASLFAAHAFPPAPHHTIFGMIRNQWGDPLNVGSGTIVLEGTNGVLLRASMIPSSDPGVNYSILISMDSGTAADLYKPTALKPFYPFKLKIQIGSVAYVPIEMSGNFSQIGKPGQSTRINLTLGEDSDHDGLPDGWENALIDAAGGGLTLADIRPGDDFDGDGISNLDEYLAGTYAFDPADGFVLALTGVHNGASTMKFLAIRNRTYTVETSANLAQWAPARFRILGGTNALMDNYLAPDVRLIEIEVPSTGGQTNNYFRAKVQ